MTIRLGMGPLLLSLFCVLLNQGVAVAECPQACSYDYTPVCGTDYKTYPNMCALDVEQCQSDSSLSKLFDGECVCSQDVACTQEYQAHCGTDGKTYSNRCNFAVAKLCSTTGLQLAKLGECGNIAAAAVCPEVCTADYTPVCGTDDKTYPNMCALNVEQCQSTTGLQLDKIGECGNTAGTVQPLAAILVAATLTVLTITY